MEIENLLRLNDAELSAEVQRLAGCEREATVALIVHLAEFDRRRLYEGAGFRSLFQYCRVVLRLSEGAAYNRIQTARATRRFPSIGEMLRIGTVSPTTVRLLAPHLTPENHGELLAAASGMGKREVEQLLACRFPQADVAASVRNLPMPRAAVTDVVRSPTPGAGVSPAIIAASPSPDAPPKAAIGSPSPPSVFTDPPTPPLPAVVRPLGPERYEIKFTAKAETREKLREAQDLLGHAVPSGDLAEVFDRALTLLVADLRRRKWAETAAPRPASGRVDRSQAPAAVRRAVWMRDRGRCAFVSKDGRRCDATRFLEFHHVHPRAAGGLATVDNIQLRCRAHNGHEVDLFFGPAVRYTKMDGCENGRMVRGGPATRSGTGSAGHG